MVDAQSIATTGLLALAVTIGSLPAVMIGLRRLQLVDVPNVRSSHRRPTLRGGGLAPAIGGTTALALAATAGSGRWPLIAGAVGFGLLGLLEDVCGVPVIGRLALQAMLAAASLPSLLEGLSGPLLWQLVFTLGAAGWLVAFVNGFNFMDGINGIGGAQALVAGVAWFVLGVGNDVPLVAASGAALAGSALGFLPANFPAARVFLGDVGSYFLGGLMALTAVVGLRAGLAAEAVFGPLALCLADTSTTILRRVRRGDAWRLPHREHAYQRLSDVLQSHTTATGIIVLLAALVSILGLASQTYPLAFRLAADVGMAGLVVLYLALPGLITRHAASRPDLGPAAG